jgi:hypothetical protein
MILEAQGAGSSTNEGRTGPRRKYEIMRKAIKSYRQVFESLDTRFPGIEQKPGE